MKKLFPKGSLGQKLWGLKQEDLLFHDYKGPGEGYENFNNKNNFNNFKSLYFEYLKFKLWIS